MNIWEIQNKQLNEGIDKKSRIKNWMNEYIEIPNKQMKGWIYEKSRIKKWMHENIRNPE